MPKKDQILGLTQTRKATLSKQQQSSDALTFVMVSAQNEGIRYTWDGEYLERLDINGADTTTLNTFFKDHNRDVDSAIGKVTNVRVEGEDLLCDVIFDESGADVKRKFENGTLSDVSIGYTASDYEVEKREDALDIVTLTKFSVHELSAVGIGFDKGAKKREKNQEGERMELEKLLARLAELEKTSKRSEDENTELQKVRTQIQAEKEKERAALAAENAELKRQAQVNALATSYGASDTLRAKFAQKGTGEEMLRAILDEKQTSQAHMPPAQPKDESTRESMLGAIGDAIALKSGVRLKDPHKDADMFRGASMIEMAKRVCDVSGYDKNEIASRAMVTADFPMLLVSTGNRILQQGYELQTSSYELWTKAVDLPDFKTNTDITLGTSGRLSELNQNGEIKEKQLTEAGEDWKLKSLANEFVITRQMIINDDLNAFNGLLSEFGKMAKRTANGIVYDLLQAKGAYANYTMKDNSAIFTAGHKNLAASGAALSEASLEAARTKVMRQVSADGDALNILPKYLMVAPEQEIIARKIIASTSSTADAKNSGVINPFHNSLEIVVDSELVAGAWYLAGDTRTIKTGYLAGTGRKPIVQLDNTSLTRTVFQGVFDFGVVAEDFRSLYKNPGV